MMKKELGKYFLDVSKLVVAGVVINAIFEITNTYRVATLIVGFVVALVFLIWGLSLIKEKM